MSLDHLLMIDYLIISVTKGQSSFIKLLSTLNRRKRYVDYLLIWQSLEPEYI